MNEKFMELAIKEARKNLKKMDGGPFGACVVKGSKVLAVARNMVLRKDATCHAEINAIRAASRRLKDYVLSGCVIYSTTEPCPMCFSAIHWAKIDRIIYGTMIEDVKKLGFSELTIKNTRMKKLGKSKIKIIGGFMLKDCANILKDWKNLDNRAVY